MATDKEFIDFVLEQLSALDDITCKSMMGEYIIYYRGRIAAYVCDNRLLIKPVEKAKELMPSAELQPPYEGAKPMLLADNVDDRDFLTNLFNEIFDQLPIPKPKKKK